MKIAGGQAESAFICNLSIAGSEGLNLAAAAKILRGFADCISLRADGWRESVESAKVGASFRLQPIEVAQGWAL